MDGRDSWRVSVQATKPSEIRQWSYTKVGDNARLKKFQPISEKRRKGGNGKEWSQEVLRGAWSLFVWVCNQEDTSFCTWVFEVNVVPTRSEVTGVTEEDASGTKFLDKRSVSVGSNCVCVCKYVPLRENVFFSFLT